MEARAKKLFAWRDAFRSKHGPRASTTRHVLLELSTYMNNDTLVAWPAIKRIATGCALSEKAVGHHLKLAEQAGWLNRKRFRANGQKWSQYRYFGTFPKSYPQPPEPRSGSTAPLPESQVEQPEPHVHNDRNHVPTNSSMNSIQNSVFKEKQKGENWQELRELAQRMIKKVKGGR